MRLDTQKRIAADVLKTSRKNIWLDTTRLDEIKESITKADIRSLIKDKAIKEKKPQETSRSRARKAALQRAKGRRSGTGSRKGKATSRQPKKKTWMDQIRAQRDFLRLLKEKKAIDISAYRSLYMLSKGGFFRSKRHIKLYIEEHGYLKK